MVGEIQIKTLPDQLVFGWRGKVRVSELPTKMGDVYSRIFHHLMGQHVDFAGPPMAIYHEMPQGDEPMEVEIGIPVTRDAAPLQDMMTHTLEGGTVATAIHTGPYDELGSAYDAVMSWIENHGYEMSGPSREAYLNGPDEVNDPSEYLTELDFPVREKAG